VTHKGDKKISPLLILQDPFNWRERGRKRGEKERERFTEILSFFERFSPHVEIPYIFYRVTFSPKRRESIYF
jgi:hypothetical protein